MLKIRFDLGENLEIDFGDDAPNGVVVTMGTSQIDYYYDNGVLKVNNVNGNITISDMSNYDLSGNNNTAIFANTTITNEGLVFDGVSSSARLPDDTGVTLPATYSLRFKTNATYHQIIFGDRTTNAGFGTYSKNSQYITTVGGANEDAPTFRFTTQIGILYQVDILYETVSATATVGLSRNLTSSLTLLGKIIIIVTMYLGRVGPITLAIAFKSKKSESNIIKNPTEEVSVG